MPRHLGAKPSGEALGRSPSGRGALGLGPRLIRHRLPWKYTLDPVVLGAGFITLLAREGMLPPERAIPARAVGTAALLEAFRVQHPPQPARAARQPRRHGAAGRRTGGRPEAVGGSGYERSHKTESLGGARVRLDASRFRPSRRPAPVFRGSVRAPNPEMAGT